MGGMEAITGTLNTLAVAATLGQERSSSQKLRHKGGEEIRDKEREDTQRELHRKDGGHRELQGAQQAGLGRRADALNPAAHTLLGSS
jgi:hypothetical protein